MEQLITPKLDEINAKVLNTINKKTEEYKKSITLKKERYLEFLYNELVKVQETKENINKKLENKQNENGLSQHEKTIISNEIDNVVKKIQDFSIYDTILEKNNLNDILSITTSSSQKVFNLIDTSKLEKQGKNQGDTDESRKNDTLIKPQEDESNLKLIVDELPAHIIPCDYCRQCRKKLSWIKENPYDYDINCGFSDNCNSAYRYGCKECKIQYCTKCAFPPNPTLCGCLREMVFHDYQSYHSCDLCRESLNEINCWRCSNCDFDVCKVCHDMQIEISVSNEEEIKQT